VIRILKTPEDTLRALADYIVLQASVSIARSKRFDFALSGGSSPKKLYELLASPHYSSQVEWGKVYLFLGDERYVPADHPDSNYKMVKTSLIEPLDIRGDHVFPVNTTLSPEESAADYEQMMRSHFANEVKFDLILLGLGDNSHTASLFPHTKVLHERSALVKAEYIDEVKMNRITFTAPLINAAHAIAFLVYGSGKAEAVKHIIKDPLNIEEYPAQLIRPVQGEVTWFLDEAAAANIK
jgi:6-phosphogluconolactonase